VTTRRIAHRSDVQRADKERMVHAIQAREMERSMRALHVDYVALKQQLDALQVPPRGEGADRSVNTDP
jgi:hypothetical protein